MTLKPALDALAISLLKDAETETKPDVKIDTFKAVAAYYLGTVRTNKGKPDSGDTPATFQGILDKIGQSKLKGGSA